MHEVMPKAYTWPNDPQVYGGDAPLYRVIFAPAGTPVPITPAGPIPICNALPSIYGYSTQYGGPNSNSKPCDIPVNQQGAVFAVRCKKCFLAFVRKTICISMAIKLRLSAKGFVCPGPDQPRVALDQLTRVGAGHNNAHSPLKSPNWPLEISEWWGDCAWTAVLVAQFSDA
jgi:hypothetical protein